MKKKYGKFKAKNKKVKVDISSLSVLNYEKVEIPTSTLNVAMKSFSNRKCKFNMNAKEVFISLLNFPPYLLYLVQQRDTINI